MAVLTEQQTIGSNSSIGFPKIFNGSTVNVSHGDNATKENLIALLSSTKGALFGDPHYGTRLKQLLYEQTKDYVIVEHIKDDVFEAIYSYMPQITVDRKSIKINVVGNVVMAYINAKNNFTNETNLYDISLLSEIQD